MCLKPYQFSYCIDTIKTDAEEFMETLFDCKENMEDGLYIHLCDKLKTIVEELDILNPFIEYGIITDDHDKHLFELKQKLTKDLWDMKLNHYSVNMEYKICDRDADLIELNDVEYHMTTDKRMYTADFEYVGKFIEETGEIIC